MIRQEGMDGGNWSRPLQGAMLIAQVVRVYLPDDPSHPALRMGTTTNGAAVDDPIVAPLYNSAAVRDVVCDLIPFGNGRRTQLLRMVPILRSGGFGVDDASVPWIPRAAENALFGGTMLPAGIPGAATQPADADGDLVVFTFLHGDPQRPVILGAMAHPRSRVVLPATRARTVSLGPTAEHRIRHRGTDVRVDSDGNVSVDTRSAHSGVYGADAVPVAGTGGSVTVTVGAGRVISIVGSAGAEVLLRPNGGAATRKVARVDDTTGVLMPVTTPTSKNPGWAELLAALGAMLVAVPVPPNVSARFGVGTWPAVIAIMAVSGFGGTITSGHDQIRTDA